MFYHTTAFYVLGCQPIGEYCSIALNCRLDGIGTSDLMFLCSPLAHCALIKLRIKKAQLLNIKKLDSHLFD